MQEGNNAFVIPRIVLNRVDRRESGSSVASQSICIFMYSNSSAFDIASCNEDKDKCIKLRKEEAACFDVIAQEVSQVLKTCKIQIRVVKAMLTKKGYLLLKI